MALVTPPSYYQAGTYPAKNDRLLTQALIGQNGAKGTAMKVVAQSTPAMSVQISVGGAFIPSSTGNGSYFAYNDAATTATITTANPTNPRIDLVYVLIQDAAISGSTNSVSFVVLAGTPASTPVAPTLPALALSLGTVYVAAGATSVTNANITDTRALSQVVDCSATSTAQVASPTAGMLVWDQSLARLYVYDGSAWQLVYPLSLGGITGGQIATNTITSSNMATGSVTTAAILDGTIQTGDIADGQITSAKIADATIVTGDLADGAVTTAKIAGSAITPAQVSNNTYTISITGSAGFATTASSASSASTAVELNNAGNRIYWDGFTWVSPQIIYATGFNATSGSGVISNGNVSTTDRFINFAPVTGSASTQYYVHRSSDNALVTRSGTSLRDHKNDIADVTGALDMVREMRPRTFTFKPEYVDMTDPQSIKALMDQTQYGFVVEEMLDIADDLVIYDYNTTKELAPKMWKEQAVLSLAVGAIKTLADKVDALEARIAILEAN